MGCLVPPSIARRCYQSQRGSRDNSNERDLVFVKLCLGLLVIHLAHLISATTRVTGRHCWRNGGRDLDNISEKGGEKTDHFMVVRMDIPNFGRGS